MKIKAFTLGFVIGVCFMIPLIGAKIENDKLKKQVKELREENIEYKWQLQEVPTVIESNKEEICK